VSDGELTDTATVTLNVGNPPPDAGLMSDDFSGGPLDTTLWSVEGPTGTSATVGSDAMDAYLELVTPDGNFDVWQTANNGARALQAISNSDFEIETRFLTTPTEGSQFQGILVEQDATNWLRFDVVSNGTTLRAFAAKTEDGASTPLVQAAIPGGEAEYLRVNRSGDDWTFEYSLDGENWTVATTFTHDLTTTSAGVFAGNVGQADGYTARVDYFEVASDPIVDEDGNLFTSTLPDPIYDAPGDMVFDGTASSVIELPHAPEFEVQEGALAFSFNPGDTNGAQGLFAKDAAGFGGGGNHAVIYLQGTNLVGRFQDGAGQTVLTVGGITAGEDHDVVANFSAAGIEIWLNGVLVASDPLVMDFTQNVEYLQWGGRGWASQSGAPGFDAPYNGTISDKQIYDTPLSPTQVAELASIDPDPNTNANPVAQDDAFTGAFEADVAGNVLADNGNGADSDSDMDALTVVTIPVSDPSNGDVILAANGDFTYTPDAGFDGTDSFTYQISDGNGGVDTGVVTITVEPSEPPTGAQPVFAVGGVSSFSGATADVINSAPDPSLEISEGTIAFSFKDANTGVRQGLLTKDAAGSEYLQIGGLGWASGSGAANFGNPFSGEIADVEIYDEVLTTAEIQTLANMSSLDGI